MNRLRFAFLIAALLALGATQTTRRPVSRASRVVLVSFDAGFDELLDRLLRERRLKGGAFERIASQGLMAESMTPPSVASTPVSHPTLFSGAWPGRHGITGASLPGAAIADELVAGFNIKTDVDRLWTIAERAGKRVVCIMAPGAEATRPDNTCSETVPFAIIGAAQPVDVALAARQRAGRAAAAIGSARCPASLMHAWRPAVKSPTTNIWRAPSGSRSFSAGQLARN